MRKLRKCAIVHKDRRLQTGDVCELGLPTEAAAKAGDAALQVPEAWRPECNPEGAASHLWTVRMLPGPQAAPDYFTEADMEVRRPANSLFSS